MILSTDGQTDREGETSIPPFNFIFLYETLSSVIKTWKNYSYKATKFGSEKKQPTLNSDLTANHMNF